MAAAGQPKAQIVRALVYRGLSEEQAGGSSGPSRWAAASITPESLSLRRLVSGPAQDLAS
jgi:hypothetical protein